MSEKHFSMALAAALFLLLDCLPTNAQSGDTTRLLTFSGYAETYYLYDFGEPDHHERPAFIYSHNRHNEVSLNLGYLKAAYAASGVQENVLWRIEGRGFYSGEEVFLKKNKFVNGNFSLATALALKLF